MIFDITAEESVLAKEYQNQIFSKLPGRPNYTGIHAENRFEVGYLGEFIVRKWLTDRGLDFEYRVKTTGKSEGVEFIVSSRSLEVKTASKVYHKHFMMPISQKVDSDFYLGVKLLSQHQGKIMGWLTREEVLSLSINDFGYGPTRNCLYPEMRAIETLYFEEPKTLEPPEWCSIGCMLTEAMRKHCEVANPCPRYKSDGRERPL